jgi:hypothetical protein
MEFWQIAHCSSEVQKLEECDGKTLITIYPNRNFIDPQRVKSAFCKGLFRLGMAPRYLNHGNDLLIFQDEGHRQRWLQNQGYSEGWINNHLLPIEFAEVIHFPVSAKTKKTGELQVA